jgi:hypothetical protein
MPLIHPAVPARRTVRACTPHRARAPYCAPTHTKPLPRSVLCANAHESAPARRTMRECTRNPLLRAVLCANAHEIRSAPRTMRECTRAGRSSAGSHSKTAKTKGRVRRNAEHSAGTAFGNSEIKIILQWSVDRVRLIPHAWPPGRPSRWSLPAFGLPSGRARVPLCTRGRQILGGEGFAHARAALLACSAGTATPDVAARSFGGQSQPEGPGLSQEQLQRHLIHAESLWDKQSKLI